MSSHLNIPDDLLTRHRIVPLSDDGSTLTVGSVDALSPGAADEIEFLTGRTVECVDVASERVDSFLSENGLQSDAAAPASGSRAPIDELTRGTVVRQVQRIIEEAIRAGASDIHIEPYESFFRVRYRMDGVLHTVGHLDLAQRDAVISRLKIMAELDIAEKRRPQDSRIRVEYDGRDVDLRVSTLPTAHGEKVVLRILDKSAINLDLSEIGLGGTDLHVFERAIRSPTGQVLVTGPTGSGKTTTLYAALNALNTESVNITTIEDPIEYNLAGVNQTRVRADIGFTFAKALRAFLRQDPNVVMVGEIRDHETAEIAVRAALTGHLVLSTLHTNDAPSTVTRLVDMGVEPYLVAASVRLIVAQRLVRRVCEECRTEAVVDAAMVDELGLDPQRPLATGAGCQACNGTGFRGRTALFELMPVSDAIGELVTQGASTQEVRKQARSEGLMTLRESGAQAVRRGITTPAEVLREVAA